MGRVSAGLRCFCAAFIAVGCGETTHAELAPASEEPSVSSEGSGGSGAAMTSAETESASTNANSSSTSGAERGTAGAAGSPPDLLTTNDEFAGEDCYVISGNGEEVRLAREAGTYTLISSSFDVDGFNVGRAVGWIVNRPNPDGFGYDLALVLYLAPSGTIAGASFQSCPYHPQNFCVPVPYDTTVLTCDGVEVRADSAAGCFQEQDGGFHVVLEGAPGDYRAEVSQNGGMATSWPVTESNDNPTYRYISLDGGDRQLELVVGLTGRVLAQGTLVTGGLRENVMFAPCEW